MNRRNLYLITLAIFLGYTAWMIGPYLVSTVVRDSSVTTWSRVAVSPIKGRIVGHLPAVGSHVGDDGVLTVVRNDHLLAEQRIVEDVRDRMIVAEARLQDAQTYLTDLERLEAERLRVRARLAEAFKSQLAIQIESLAKEIAENDAGILIVERMVERESKLVSRGTTSKASLDETLLRLSELRATRADQTVALDFALIRKEQAKNGIYLTADGDIPGWVNFALIELKMETNRARRQNDESLVLLDEAVRDLAITTERFDRLSSSPVIAPPGSMIFGLKSAPGANVAEGTAVAEWIDCKTLLVDVPISDLEVALVNPGDPANVILEGESEERTARVHLTRGSSAVLGRSDLAALAKGRTDGVGQVLLLLDDGRDTFESCPVGRAAYVEFPDIGLLDMLMARLRL